MERSPPLRAVLARYATAPQTAPPVRAVAELVATDTLSRATFDDLLARHHVEVSGPFRDELLDLVLAVIREALRDHALTKDEQAYIRELKVLLRIPEGDFYRHRRTAVAAILGGVASSGSLERREVNG